MSIITRANVHDFATGLIILDRTLHHTGAIGMDARAVLRAYTEEALVHPMRVSNITASSKNAGRLSNSRKASFPDR